MTPLIDSLYKTDKTVAKSGEVIEIHSQIAREEGQLLYNLIAQDPAIKRTLEVGCAYGLSSLHICEALRGRAGAHHVIIDAFQATDWHGVGVMHLDQSGIDFYEWLEERSEYALPRLAQNGSGTYDLIFIDGMHTFDHTLIDAFYSLRLLRSGGILVIDDCDFEGIDKVISYLKNYPCIKVHATLERPPASTLRGKARSAMGLPFFQAILPHTLQVRYKQRSQMVALKKEGDDNRAWNWYAPF